MTKVLSPTNDCATGLQDQPTYWVQVYTAKTWQEFLESGGKTTGFRSTRWGMIQQIRPGDLLLCYLSGLGKFIGALAVQNPPYLDTKKIWADELFPCRVDVRIVISLNLSAAVPIRDLNLSIFSKQSWGAYLMASPSRWKESDGKCVFDAISTANEQESGKESPLKRSASKR